MHTTFVHNINSHTTISTYVGTLVCFPLKCLRQYCYRRYSRCWINSRNYTNLGKILLLLNHIKWERNNLICVLLWVCSITAVKEMHCSHNCIFSLPITYVCVYFDKLCQAKWEKWSGCYVIFNRIFSCDHYFWRHKVILSIWSVGIYFTYIYCVFVYHLLGIAASKNSHSFPKTWWE